MKGERAEITNDMTRFKPDVFVLNEPLRIPKSITLRALYLP